MGCVMVSGTKSSEKTRLVFPGSECTAGRELVAAGLAGSVGSVGLMLASTGHPSVGKSVKRLILWDQSYD